MSIEALEQRLAEVLEADLILRNEPMARHTTFKVGGPADLFVAPSSVDEISACVAAAQETGVPWRVLGAGSNVLVADEGVRGLVIHLGKNYSSIAINGTFIYAQAGATNEEVAMKALDKGLRGYEFASGIPGSIGGAAIMNAGAYDGEFKDVCENIICLTPEGEVLEIGMDDADLSYRHSLMMDKGYVVLEAILGLQPGDTAKIAAKIEELTRRRAEKQPLEMGSAGSTFKRPEGRYAGQLIEEAGMRGHRVGDAMVSEKHCGFVVNTGNATAADVLAVIHDVQEAVLANSGVQLEPEVRIWE